MVFFTSGYEFCHWRIHWNLFENHLIKWERPLEQFKINLTNSLELDLSWQPVLSKLLTLWLPVSLSLSAATNSLPKGGWFCKKWSQTSQLGSCLGLKSAPGSQLSSLSFNSFSVLHSSFISECLLYASEDHAEVPEMDQTTAEKSLWIQAAICQIPKWSWNRFIYLFIIPFRGTSSLDIAPRGYNCVVLGTRMVWSRSTVHVMITICILKCILRSG